MDISSQISKALGDEKFPKLKIFIINTQSDKQLAANLIKMFRHKGFLSWDSENCILPGKVHNTEQEKAIYEADVVLGIMSSSTVITAGRYSALLRIALDAQIEQPDGVIKFISILVDDCDLPFEFRKYQPLNMALKGAADKLVSSLRNRSNSFVIKEGKTEAIWK